jgi:Lon protease-like protein
MTDDQAALSKFNGTARLFPLPNLVLFPHVVQPLHIFEPRYRQMTRDALAGDRLIAMVLLRPGWEADYQGRPPLHPVACLGRILAEQRLDDGRYNLLLRGLRRVRLLDEIPSDTLYRTAHVELLADQPPADDKVRRDLRRRLAETVPVWFTGQSAVIAQFQKLFQGELELGTLCDILSFALPLDVEFKQTLLATLPVEDRVRRLLRQLAAQKPPAAGANPPAAEAPRKFPPEFSSN